MLIENIMYFALGLLVASLVGLILLSAVWKRAVRLTKRRIEAATPITMAEFRADKDQLRAEFALATRRLETTIEGLRRRLATEVGDTSEQRAELGALRAEREQYAASLAEMNAREAELRGRLQELERETTDLAQRLRMRERELETRMQELAQMRKDASSAAPAPAAQRAPAALADAEARLADAKSRLNDLLAEPQSGAQTRLLADELSLEDEMERLRRQVAEVESAILEGGQPADDTALRERLRNIAGSVSRIVYAADRETPAAPDLGESLFERVQRFAADDEELDLMPPAPQDGANRGSVSERMAALREIQGR